jgi:hypothetical protein
VFALTGGHLALYPSTHSGGKKTHDMFDAAHPVARTAAIFIASVRGTTTLFWTGQNLRKKERKKSL